MKNFEFINKRSLKEFKALPDAVRDQFSLDLQAIQQNKMPFSEFKHLKDSVGVGAIELIENGRPAYRTIYVAKYAETVFILHSFTKTTNGVDKQAMKTAKSRYKLMQQGIEELKKKVKKPKGKKRKP
jgi:phage-related protein